jgi:hypothetical protein
MMRLARKAEDSPERAAALTRETLARLRETWEPSIGAAMVPDSHIQALREHWQSVPLLREIGELP